MGTADLLSEIEEVEVVMGKKRTLEVPPVGFATVIEAVPAEAMSEARTVAFTCVALRKVVERGLPFHFTTELERKPTPFTVSVNCELPGVVLAGTRGWSISGTGSRVPLPERLTSRELKKNSLSVTTRDAVRGPRAEGVNLRVRVQLAPGVTPAEHVLL